MFKKFITLILRKFGLDHDLRAVWVFLIFKSVNLALTAIGGVQKVESYFHLIGAKRLKIMKSEVISSPENLK